MAVRRSSNFLNQQRIDIPHMRSIESAIRNDFDELISAFAIGANQSYILRGFTLNMVGAVGASASSLQMIVDNGALFHGKSAQAGTFFQVASGTANQTLNSTTNTAVSGSFTPSALNYIGLEFTRAVDNTTTAQVFLWNPTNKNETSKTVPLAETLNYKIVITSSVWASNVLPISIVETDASNNVQSVQDRRPMLFRLGTGGTNTPDPYYKYPWTNHSEGREENFWQSTSSTSPFLGGDKQILHFKEWADAIMSALIEIKGTTYWYSENSGGSIVKLRGDLGLLQMTGSGKFIHSAVTAGQMNWDSDLQFDYIGSRLSYKILSNASSTNLVLADNQVAYITLVRGVDIVPNLIFTQSSAIVSSVGSVSWTTGLQAGDFIKLGSQDDTKYYKIQSVDTSAQVTLSTVYLETSTGSGGAQAKYAYGNYQVVSAPTTSRHVFVADRKDVPFNEDTYWLLLRNDNGGSAAKVYLRGSNGGEIQQGEEREISDNETLNVIDYIGSPSEVTKTPNYSNAITTGLKETTLVTFPAASVMVSGEYFLINSALDTNSFYVWANIAGAGGDPNVPGKVGISYSIGASDTAIQVAAAAKAAIDASPYFDVTDNFNGSITIVNSQAGDTTNASNGNMPSGFSISVTQEGAGSYNSVVVDDENLTKSIKRLDEALGEIAEAIAVVPYQESISIVSTTPSSDQEIQGPVVAGTSVKVPVNTRNSNLQESYVVNKADLEIHLNGSVMIKGRDYTEVGAANSDSIYVQFTFQLVVGDVIDFRKLHGTGSGGSGGSASGANLGSVASANVFKQTIGSQLQFRRLQAGTNIAITENSDNITISATGGVSSSQVQVISGANYTIPSTDDVIHVYNMGANRTLTLPSASAVPGKILYIKKIDSGNTLYIKSVSGQTLDTVDISASPLAITIQFEAITIIAVSGNWWMH